MAVCDVNPEQFSNSQPQLGNIAGAAADIDSTAVRTYRDFDRMLAEEKLDAVSITVPTHLHAEYSIKALKAGINVLCEKPMALNIGDCDRMIEAAEKAGRLLQIGHCIRFWPEYARAGEIVAAGRYGNIVAATFRRLCARPEWAWRNWVLDDSQSGGMALDLHIHDSDFIQYLLGMPAAVRSIGAHSKAGELVHIITHYLYDDDRLITAEGSWAAAPGFGFEMSFNIMLEEATIAYDCTRKPTLRVCPAQDQEATCQPQQADGYQREVEHFAARLRGENPPEVITPRQSRESLRIVQAEIESAATGRVVSLKEDKQERNI